MPPSSIKITKANASVLEELRDICITTFAETYEHLNTPANFKKYIETSFGTGQLARELDNKDSMTFMLYAEKECIGYLKLNTGSAQTEGTSPNALEIERIYVLKKYQGAGYGKCLLDFAVEKANELAKEYLWLGVWEKNHKAISFYEKNDFKKFGQHLFILGDDAQTDYLYKKTV